MTEKEAIEKLHNEKKIDLITLIRKFKKEGIENFVVTRPEIIETVLKALEQKDKEIQDHKIELLQYKNLRKNFKRLTKEVLGEDYYNMAMDVYKSDEIVCDDIINKKVKMSFPTKK